MKTNLKSIEFHRNAPKMLPSHSSKKKKLSFQNFFDLNSSTKFLGHFYIEVAAEAVQFQIGKSSNTFAAERDTKLPLTFHITA